MLSRAGTMHARAVRVTMCTVDVTYSAYDFRLDEGQEARGCTDEQVRGVLGGNVLRVVQEVS